MSFICKSCGELIGEDDMFTTTVVPSLGGRVCLLCHNEINHIANELEQNGQFTFIDESGNITILGIM